MFDLALHHEVDEPISLKTIAERQNIPEGYLEQLMAVLRRAGLITSVRGAQGGYNLARHPGKIYVGEIIRVLEGPLAPLACVSELEPKECNDADYCIIRAIWVRVRDNIAEVLDSVSLSDMCNDAVRASGQETVETLGQYGGC